MLHLSRQSDYGLVLLGALAELKSEGFVSLKEIARERHLPYRFLSKILSRLVQAGLVESKEGVRGGYRLLKEAQEISLAEALSALDEGMRVVDCDDCQRMQSCESQSVLKALEQHVAHFLKSHSIAELKSVPTFHSNVSFKPARS